MRLKKPWTWPAALKITLAVILDLFDGLNFPVNLILDSVAYSGDSLEALFQGFFGAILTGNWILTLIPAIEGLVPPPIDGFIFSITGVVLLDVLGYLDKYIKPGELVNKT